MDYKQILKDFLGVEVAEAVTSPEVVEKVVDKIVEVEKPARTRKAMLLPVIIVKKSS